MSRPKGSKNKPKTAEGKQQVQAVVNTLLSTGIVKRSEGTGWQRACLISQEARDIQEFCEKKGFPPSELIEKYEGLEKELKDTKEFYKLPFSQNKPYDAPEMPKNVQDEPDFQKGKEGAENTGESDPGVMHWIEKAESEGKEVGVKPASPKQMKESKPKELSPFLKSRQNLKNGIK